MASEHDPESFPPADDPEVALVRQLILRLDAERRSQGMTLRQLSKATGYHHSLFGRSAQGKVTMGMVPLLKWCRALGLEWNEVLRDLATFEKKERGQ